MIGTWALSFLLNKVLTDLNTNIDTQYDIKRVLPLFISKNLSQIVTIDAVKSRTNFHFSYKNEKYYCRGSSGNGNAAEMPWIGIFSEKINAQPERGVYIVFLIDSKASKVYLSLNQGVTDKNCKGRESAELIRSQYFKDLFTDFLATPILSTAGIEYGNKPKNYFDASIFYKEYSIEKLNEDSLIENDLAKLLDIYRKYILSQKPLNYAEQQIFFGAPGTGKSHTIKSEYLVDVSEDNIFRTTFHPDYDYAQFVGSYKPKKNGSVITYEFVPQVFAKAYVAAWKNYLEDQENPKPVYLVIEEINRGNCAQIFGDIFQLLDRNESGESQYEIDVDSDFAEWLGESKIKLPPNFNILATMNTSDQSLFPMDSAFKRRFDWEYVPIKYFKDSKCGESWNADKFEIKLDDNTSFSWLHFLKKVNADISKVTDSEDKQMGEFFVKPKDGVIGLDMFRSKILFYLWDSVYKDEPDQKTIFHFNYPEKSGSKVTFQSLFSDDAKAIEIINQMMKNLDEAYESKDDSEFKDFKILK